MVETDIRKCPILLTMTKYGCDLKATNSFLYLCGSNSNKLPTSLSVIKQVSEPSKVVESLFISQVAEIKTNSAQLGFELS